MYQRFYFIDKSTGTFADVLATYGLAKILDRILAQALGEGARRRVWIQDAGPYYLIELDHVLKPEWVENCDHFTPAAYVKTSKTIVPPEGSSVRDVDETWEQFNRYRERRENSREALEHMAEDARRQLDDGQLRHDWSVVVLLGTQQMQALSTYNQVVHQWFLTQDYFTVNLQTLLHMCATPYTDMGEVADMWRRKVNITGVKHEMTAIQLLNPHQGKGLNRPKANSLTMGNEKSFWLLEYMKAVGLWIGAAPRTVQGSKDRKIYVLAPNRITLGAHQAVFETFSERLWSETVVKMDCMSALLYVETLLEYSEAGQYNELDFDGYGPENVVTGFHVTQYKLLSANAYTAMNLAFLGLPAWTGDVQNPKKISDLQKVIREHKAIIDSINENHSAGYNLLQYYRDFLLGGRWEDFFKFAAGYSHYIISQLARAQHWIPSFTTQNLRRLIMATNEHLNSIIENIGFQNVAYAIRRSTIIPQGRKAKNEENLYQIRYGLGMDLKRKATVRDDFVIALADFMQSYNQENNQVLERQNRQMRRDLRTSDIQDIIKLVDTFGAEVVANLLVAFGYAREPREETNAEPQSV